MTTAMKAANKANAAIMAAKSDLWEAQHYTTKAEWRARRTAKREAARAARRVPVLLDEIDETGGDEFETPAETRGKWVHVVTQYVENYGDQDDPYWKFKGGETFVIELGDQPWADLADVARRAVEAVRGQIEYSNDFAQSYILDWNIVTTPETEDEKLQIEYDGRIVSPSPRLAVAA